MKIRLHTTLALFSFLLVNAGFSQHTETDSLLNIVNSPQNDTIKVRAFNDLFLALEYRDPGIAKVYLDKALALAKKIDYKRELAVTYICMGYFEEDNGRYDGALKNYFLALKTNESIGNQKGAANAYNNIGIVYKNQGNYPEALKNYFTSLKIKEAIGDKNGIARANNNIGNLYEIIGNYPEALKNHFASLKIAVEMGNKHGVADSYGNIGLVYYDLKNYQEALKNYFASIEIEEEMNDRQGLAISYNNLGIVYSDQGDYETALKNHFNALKLYEALGHKEGVASSCGSIGTVCLKQNKLKEAEMYLLKAKALSLEIHNKRGLKNCYGLLSVLDSAKGNWKSAYENHNFFILYRDSLDNEEVRKKTIQNQMTYDFEKKEAVANAEHKKELENQELLSEEKNRKQKFVIVFVLFGLLLVLVFAGFIFRSLRVTRKQKKIIERQKIMVEEKQREIVDSIYYARRIQRSLLPTEKYIIKNIKRLQKK